MFDALQERIRVALAPLQGRGRLTEEQIKEALREVRLALLEADVNLKVVRDFLGRVQTRAVGSEVMESLTPAQQVVKIVHEELVATLGSATPFELKGKPAVVVLVGLQGAGKTTTAAKLALTCRKRGGRPLLVAADLQRPAAIEQLKLLGRQINVPVYTEVDSTPPVLCRHALDRIGQFGADTVIIDTAGRIQIDAALMQEVADICGEVNPQQVLLVVDAMTGQEAVNVAQEFQKTARVTGMVLTKVDGDARGGAALSVCAATGMPIYFLSTGEHLTTLEEYHPDRLAGLILGMGDVLTLIERAQEQVDAKKAAELEKKVKAATFDLDDFLDQLNQLRRMGPLTQLLGLIPGFSQLKSQIPTEALEDGRIRRIEAIIQSMNPKERQSPEIINGPRRQRIARGSGVSVSDVNQLIRQFLEMRRLLKDATQNGKLNALMGGGPVKARSGASSGSSQKKGKSKRRKR